MDRKKKVAYSYFDLKKEKYCDIINNQLSCRGENKKVVLKDRFISDFKFLFGIEETLSYFFEWVISNKKINLPENTQFVYRNIEWMRNEGLLWTEILSMPGVKKSLRWIYSNGEITKLDSLIELGEHGMSLEQVREKIMAV
jgi:hypothetical protein